MTSFRDCKNLGSYYFYIVIIINGCFSYRTILNTKENVKEIEKLNLVQFDFELRTPDIKCFRIKHKQATKENYWTCFPVVNILSLFFVQWTGHVGRLIF